MLRPPIAAFAFFSMVFADACIAPLRYNESISSTATGRAYMMMFSMLLLSSVLLGRALTAKMPPSYDKSDVLMIRWALGFFLLLLHLRR